ncbi:MAG: SGNH/GDSL hydrolase family protein [Monoglobales bacterium]
MKILFQGDSITDAGRSRDYDEYMGQGYPTLVAGKLGYDYPGKYEFVNRGISGNRIVDLYARIKIDMINLKPDVMSILIGVNDVWHEFSSKNGVETERFEKVYNLLIEDLKAALPNLKIMILEPFLLPGGASDGKYDEFLAQVKEKAEAAKRVALKNNLVFVPLQEEMEKKAAISGPDKILTDGVHPIAAGHEIIKNQWLKGFEKLL